VTTTPAIPVGRVPDVAGQLPARLITRPLLVRFVSVVGTATSFYLLLSAVPLYARSAGASTGTAGLTTTALTLSSVAAYLVTPRLMARYGVRLVLAAGLLALGLPALALAGPAATFSATTMAVGIIVTFLPLAVTRTPGDVATLALLLQPATAIAGRWLAGRYGDRRGSAALLAPGVLVAAAGMLTLGLAAIPAAVIAGAAVFGLGFGVTQNVTQTLMYDRVAESAYGAVSAMWNLAYDGGMGLGAAGFGVLATRTGYPAAFALTAMLLPLSLLPLSLLPLSLLLKVLAAAGAWPRGADARHRGTHHHRSA
jgi:MFS family permease